MALLRQQQALQQDSIMLDWACTSQFGEFYASCTSSHRCGRKCLTQKRTQSKFLYVFNLSETYRLQSYSYVSLAEVCVLNSTVDNTCNQRLYSPLNLSLLRIVSARGMCEQPHAYPIIVHTGQGNLAAATKEFKIAGGFAFVTALVSVRPSQHHVGL